MTVSAVLLLFSITASYPELAVSRKLNSPGSPISPTDGMFNFLFAGMQQGVQS